MNYTGITVRSMRRADILAGVQAALNSPTISDAVLEPRLRNAEIIAYQFGKVKDTDGYLLLRLALKTKRGDVEAAVVKYRVDFLGELYATFFTEDELDGWCYNFPPKILRILTPAHSEVAQAWRAMAIDDAAERAAIKTRIRTLKNILCANA